jgi:hypothetical protein
VQISGKDLTPPKSVTDKLETAVKNQNLVFGVNQELWRASSITDRFFKRAVLLSSSTPPPNWNGIPCPTRT